MNPLRGTLLADGSSDRMLLAVVRWLLEDLGVQPELRWANPLVFPKGTRGLVARAEAAVDREPCDVLFVHRDAEATPLDSRVQEIRSELQAAIGDRTPYICVVPVRMTEAWFLFQEGAIRAAAGNPRGLSPLGLPRLEHTEALPDPKSVLYSALCGAGDLRGRHLKRFRSDLGATALRVAELIDDYSPLRRLPAFRAFQAQVESFIRGRNEMYCRGYRESQTHPSSRGTYE